MIQLSYFWALEAGLGILALRSLNFANDEARDKVTPFLALFKLQIFSLMRESAANGFLRVMCTPWELKKKFSHHFAISFILTGLFGRYYSVLCIVETILTIRNMLNNTKAYQGTFSEKFNKIRFIGQEGIGPVYKATIISLLVYTLGYLLTDGQLVIGFSITGKLDLLDLTPWLFFLF